MLQHNDTAQQDRDSNTAKPSTIFNPTHHPPCAGAFELAWGAVLPAGGAGYRPGMERVAFRPKG